MALRIFRAVDGRDWQVWDTKVDGRVAASDSGLGQGWLSFEPVNPGSPGRRAVDAYPERRRIMPIPADWELASVDDLRALWARAERAVSRGAAIAAAAAREYGARHGERRAERRS